MIMAMSLRSKPGPCSVLNKQTAFYFSCSGQVLARQGAGSHGGKEVPTVLAGDEWSPHPMMGRAISEMQ